MSTVLFLVFSFFSAFPQSNAPDALEKVQVARKHVRDLALELLRLHWQWIDANEKSVGTERASIAALEAANKCTSGGNDETRQAQSLIDAADADLKIAGSDTADARLIENAVLADVQYTVNSLVEQDPGVVRYASFRELQQDQLHCPWVAMLARTGLDPSDDPMTGQGLLSAAQRNLKDAREALARCTGHAAAPGSGRELFASRSGR